LRLTLAIVSSPSNTRKEDAPAESEAAGAVKAREYVQFSSATQRSASSLKPAIGSGITPAASRSVCTTPGTLALATMLPLEQRTLQLEPARSSCVSAIAPAARILRTSGEANIVFKELFDSYNCATTRARADFRAIRCSRCPALTPETPHTAAASGYRHRNVPQAVE